MDREEIPTGPLTAGTHDTSDIYRLLVDRVLDYAIFVLDPRGYIQSWNGGAQRLKGYRADEIIGRHFSIFYPEVDLDAGKPEYELEVAAATGRYEDLGWRVRKDGSYFWANVLITALRDEDGVLVGFAKITRDLTERRLTEEALRESETKFRLLVESVKDHAIFMLDPTGHITTWNEGARRITGYTAAEATGQHFSISYPTEDVADGKPARHLAVALREGEFEEEGWRVRKNGARFWASVVLTPVYNADGTLAGFAKVTRELTERRASQERALEDASRLSELKALADQLRAQAVELERRSAEAETANRVKGEFLAAMSHELRTPLNAIGGYAQLMQLGVSGPVTDEQRAHLERIEHSQQHLLSIINDILNFTRIEAGYVDFLIGPVRISEVIEGVVAMIAPQARAQRIHLHAGPCPALIATADRAKVEQIMLNLLSNAVKFTLEGGEIELTCATRDAQIALSVRDTGIGIPAVVLDTIFAPFVQVGRTLSSPKEGAGLGLSISRELARAMHGDLTVRSLEGVGSCFTLTLPAFSAS